MSDAKKKMFKFGDGSKVLNKQPVSELPAKSNKAKGSGEWSKFIFALEKMVPVTAQELGVQDHSVKNAFFDHKRIDPAFRYTTRTINKVLTFYKTEGEVKPSAQVEE